MRLVPGSHAVPLVGRDRELAVLDKELQRSSSGTTRCVIVGGEAGIGKTRLLAEMGTRAGPDSRVAWGQCVEMGTNGVPYAPFISALRSLSAEIGRDGLAQSLGPGRAELARLLPELGPAAPESDVGRGRLFEAVASLLERGAEAAPVVVVIEDLHWADSSTRELLAFLVRSLQDAPVLLALSYRTDEMHRTHPLRRFLAEMERSPRVTRVTVPRLPRGDVAALLARLRGEQPAHGLVEDVVARTGGVPFFVEELADLEPGSELPETLRDLLMVRVEALSEPARRVLAVASVGGVAVSHDDLASVATMPSSELDQALREAVSSHQLVVDRTHAGYVFRHALVREAVHDDLLPGEHVALHERWAQALAARLCAGVDPSIAVQVSHHWHAAYDTERAFEASLTAADATRSMYAPREEMQMLDRVLELWARVSDPETLAGGDRVSVLVRAGEAAWKAGEDERSAAFHDAALREVDAGVDPQRRASILIRRATCGLDTAGRGAVEMLSQALDLLPDDEPSTDRASALAKLAAWHVLRDDWDVAAELAERGRKQAQLAGDAEAESSAVNTLALAYAGMGEVETSRDLFEVARRLAVESGSDDALLRYLGNLGDLLLGMGRFAEAADVSREGREHAVRQGLARSAATFMAGNEAEALIALGRWDEALDRAEQALGQGPPKNAWAHLSCQRASILVRRGDPTADQVVDSLARVTTWFPGQPQHVIPVAALQAERALLNRDVDGALATLQHAIDQVGPRAHASVAWSMLHTFARAITDPGADARSARRARQVIASVRQTFTPSGLQSMWDALLDAELATDDATSAERWSAAYDKMREPAVEGPAFLRAYIPWRLAESLLADGQRDEATPLLAAALDQARALGASPLESDIVSLARRARVPVAGSIDTAAPEPRDGTALTPREREVLQLVAEGRSNAQIANLLFISAKTASVHVSNILAKLGVSSRGEAAAAATAQGLVDLAARGA
jgi:DNA-binding CsgD family transcriptional regulator